MPYYIYTLTQINGSEYLQMTPYPVAQFSMVKNLATGGHGGAKRDNKVKLVLELPNETTKQDATLHFWRLAREMDN
jgi:hypothetical protein